MKIVKSLKEFGLLIKAVSETSKTVAKEQRCGFLVVLLGTLGTSLLGNMLASKGVKRSRIPGRGVMKAGVDAIRAGQGF